MFRYLFVVICESHNASVGSIACCGGYQREKKLSKCMHEASSLRAGSVARIAIRGFLALIAILAYGYCAAEVRMTHVGNVDKLVPRVEFLEDPAGVLTFGDVILAKHSEHFKTVPEESQPNFGLSRSVIWLRMSFALEKGAPPDRLLEVAYPFLGSVELFSDGLHVASGAARPFSTRPVAHRNFIFPLTLEEGATQTYYLRVSSEGTLTIPIQLWQPDAFHRGAQDTCGQAVLRLALCAAICHSQSLDFFTLWHDWSFTACFGAYDVSTTAKRHYFGGRMAVYFSGVGRRRIQCPSAPASQLSLFFSTQAT
ncbi:hypothetical protein EGT07_14885 [Herbaspirillum sp. HC18]|nr:hypothetical protein EGT07_14885 [Herbaspirillum sp. HC18]